MQGLIGDGARINSALATASAIAKSRAGHGLSPISAPAGGQNRSRKKQRELAFLGHERRLADSLFIRQRELIASRAP